MTLQDFWLAYWLPGLLVALALIGIQILILWFIIYTAVRAALRSMRDQS
ncbi:hypothetical protein [Microbacterium sp. G2-8]|nr:hypothetical protein [Microbacterium sp. G2-8]